MSHPLFSRTNLEAAAQEVYRHMPPTPQYCWPLLSQRIGAEVWVKHENHTPLGAFKVRGGLVYFKWLKEAHPTVTGVISATRGNHGQSVAFAAKKAGIAATIVVPNGNSREKNAAMRALGARLIEYGDDFQESIAYTHRLAEEEGLHLVPSFHELLVQGVGSYALEFFTALPDLHTVYVPIGLGSGICGMMAARDALGLKTRIVGVVSAHADAYAQSFAQKKPIETATCETIADGVACRIPHPEAFAWILKGVERVVTVTDEEVLRAMKVLYTDTHNVAEGAGAVSMAAALQASAQLQGEKLGVVISGGNVDYQLYQRALAVEV